MRPIDADALLKRMPLDLFWDAADVGMALHTIENAPTLDVEPVGRGTWTILLDDDGNEVMECSECAEVFYDGDNDTVDNLFNFCPSCGTRMESNK